MAAFDVLERSRFHLAQVKSQLHLAWNAVADLFLIVPGIAVPAVKIVLRRQRFPALGFAQGVRRPDISIEDALDQRMQGDVDKSLCQRQHILNREPVPFAPFVAIAIVPAHVPQTVVETRLHVAQHLVVDQRR